MDKFNQLTLPKCIALAAIGIMLWATSCGAAAAAPPTGAPKELKLGFVDFLSGSAAVFGISGKNKAEWMIAK